MKDVQTDWPLELRSVPNLGAGPGSEVYDALQTLQQIRAQALHSGGSLWHLDKGLLRFLLSNVLQKAVDWHRGGFTKLRDPPI